MSAAESDPEIKHIAVWMPNWIGDVVFALPAVQAIRKQYPRARITAMVHPPSDQFLSGHPDIDSVIALNAKGWRALWFALGLRKYHFDLGILFPNSIRAALMQSLAGTQRRIGYATEMREFLLTDSVPVGKGSRSMHAVDYFYGVLEPLEIAGKDRTVSSLLTENESKGQKDLLSTFGIHKRELVIAVSPGASKPEKRWHVERFGILCQKLVKEKNAKILLMGSEGERELIEKIQNFCPRENTIQLLGLNLKVVAGLLKQVRMLVANDSGLMNLAAAVGTPVVGIFGPGSPKTTDPLIAPEKKEIVSRHFECSPCRHKFFKDCKPSAHNKPFCIEDISVSDVADAVDRLLAKTG